MLFKMLFKEESSVLDEKSKTDTINFRKPEGYAKIYTIVERANLQRQNLEREKAEYYKEILSAFWNSDLILYLKCKWFHKNLDFSKL